jgi:hypothetical protein
MESICVQQPEDRPARIKLLFLAAAMFATIILLAPLLLAGPEPYTSKQVRIGAPGWLASMPGDSGVKGAVEA